jgi:flagellar basal body-associated protein FliL
MSKRFLVSLLVFLTLVICVVALPTASATHTQIVVHSDQSYQINIQLDQGATFVFGWTATHALTEVFRDPSGATIKVETGSSSGGTGYKVPTTGQYSMTWTNLQSTDATLTVDYFGNVNGFIDIWIAVMIIGLLVLVVVVVVIMAIVMRKPRMPPQPPQYQYQQQYQQQPPPPPPSR